jgi:hypothetical protein
MTERAAGSRFRTRDHGKGEPVDDDISIQDYLEQILKELNAARTIPSTSLALRQRAVDDAVDYISSDRRFDDMRVSLHNASIRATALREVTGDGLVAEFGVHEGASLTQIASFFPDRTVHAFDSFVGLPTAWSAKDAGAFDVGGHPPDLTVPNVEFHVGWFEDTLPAFAAESRDPLAFVHLDADLYSSTATVFDHLGDRFVAGTILVFDEYFGYHGWQRHEHRAFQEFLARAGLDFEAIGVGHMNLAVRLVAG